jgi:hypothetical protein
MAGEPVPAQPSNKPRPAAAPAQPATPAWGQPQAATAPAAPAWGAPSAPAQPATQSQPTAKPGNGPAWLNP